MKKRLLIIAGLTIILSLLGVWGYILVYGTPESVDEVFATFGSGNATETTAPPIPLEPPDDDFLVEPEETDVDNINQEAVRQITTEPVAGFQLLQSADEGQVVLYAKSGSGHIYKHDLATNARDRLSNTTIPQAHDAYFTTDGSYAAVMRGHGSAKQLHIFDLNNTAGTTTEPTIVRINAQNIAVADDNTLLYTITEGLSTRAFAYDFSSGSDKELFQTPLTQITVVWGDNADARHYFYPRPAMGLMSPVFAVTNGSVRRTPIEGYDLSLIYQNGVLAYSYDTKVNRPTNTGRLLPVARDSFVSMSDNLDQRSLLNLMVRNDVCTISTTESLLCATSIDGEMTTPAEQRRGIRGAHLKFIFTEQITDSVAQSLINLEQTSGRTIDVSKLQLHETPDRDIILFINNTDGVLWLYEIF